MLLENYKLCLTPDELKDYIGDSHLFAFDFETSPSDSHRDDPKASLDAHRSHIVGISFSVEEHSAVYVPLRHRIGKNCSDRDKLWEYLRKLFTCDNRIKIAHSLAFESMFLYAKNIIVREPCYDTIAALMLTLKSENEFRTLNDSGLKTVFPTMTKFADVTDGRFFDELDPSDDATIEYACADSDYALRLYNICNRWFNSNLPKHRKIVEQIESPTAVYCGLMKYNGVPFDIESVKKQKDVLTAELNELKGKIDTVTGGIDIGKNATSAAFKKFLFDDLKLPVVSKTDKGAPKTDDISFTEWKEYCAENGKPELIDFLCNIEQYKKKSKLLTTYIDGYLKYLNPVTGCIHPSLMPLGTTTGRFSSQAPNLQNIPRISNDDSGMRNFFIAPENHKLLSIDFSQIELRVGAFYCRDEKMIDTYKNNGDIHSQTAEVIFGKEETTDDSKHTSEHRTIAKSCNFGVFYGLFPKGLMMNLKYNAGIKDITYERCEEIIKKLKEGYPRLTEWQIKEKTKIHLNGYTETHSGRRRYLPDIDAEDKTKVRSAERKALNTPIQGTAADILKMAMARIVAGISDKPWLKPILQIHDELIFIVPDEHIAEAVEFVKAAMEVKPYPDFDVPLRADPEVGQSFGTLAEYKGDDAIDA
ncbi:MAG: DNA polymerase [Clostridia bacterium]|nr:DNA polymerase [Clostridia bacterium]